MCKIIAIANQKGGVGKTTTTSNLGIGLAKQGKKVLLIDADAQGSLTASLGFTEPDSLEITLATIMGNLINDGEVEPGEGILHHEEGIDLMPGNIELSGLEVSLVNVMSRETVLRSYIEIVRESYDYILIDCMPSLGMITINAFACADSILIPVQAAYLPVKGLQQLIKTVGKVKRQINPKLEIEGILLTMVDSRTNYAKDMMTLIEESTKRDNADEEFDRKYREIADQIKELKKKKSKRIREMQLAESYEQRAQDVEGYMKKTSYLKREFDDDLVRRLLQSIRVINENKIEIQFKSGIVMMQRIDGEE